MATDAPAGRGLRLARTLGVEEAGRALRDFATYLPTQVIPAIAGLLVLPILARKLAPSELGVLAIAQTLISLGWIVAGNWMTTALIRELPAARHEGRLQRFSAVLLRALGLSGVAFALFACALAVAGMASSTLGSNVGLVAAAAAGLILQNVAATLYAAELRPRAFAVVEILARVGGITLGVVLVFAGHEVAGYLLGVALASLVIGSIGVVAAWPRTARDPQPSRAPFLPELRRWAEYGVPVAIAATAAWALFFVDRYLLVLLKDTAAAGIYSVGAVIGDKAVAIPTYAFFIGARPLLFKAMEEQGRPEVERLVRAWTRVILLIGAPIVAVAAVSSSAVVKITGGSSYAAAAEVVGIVAFGSLLWALALFGNSGLTTARQSRPFVYAATLALGANVAANLVLIPAYGIKGAAIATPIGNAVFLFASQIWARRYATWRFPWTTLARTAVAAAAGYGAGRATLAGLDSYVAAGGACIVVYAVTLLALGERKGDAQAGLTTGTSSS